MTNLQTYFQQVKSSYLPGISTDIYYYVDSTNQLTEGDVLNLTKDFKQAAITEIPYQLSEHSYWLLLKINNSANNNEQIQLYTDNYLLEKFTIYQLDTTNNSKSIVRLIGDLTNEKTLYPNTLLEINANQSTTYLLHLKSYGPPHIPILLSSVDYFNKINDFQTLFITVLITSILLMSIYNLVIYFAVKDIVYLFYISYLLSTFVVLASINGYGKYIFSAPVNWFFGQYTILFHYVLVLSLLLFTLHFLRYESYKPKLYRMSVLLCLVVLLIGIATSFLANSVQAKIFFSLQPFFLVLSLYFILKRIKYDFSWARFYFISWVPLLSGSAIQPLVLLNILPHTFVTRNAFAYAVLIEITLMAFALAERMRRHEKDRINEIRYHSESKLPRKSNLEAVIRMLSAKRNAKFSVIILKPEHIDKISHYIDDAMNTELFKYLNKKLSSLVCYNDAVIPLTDNQEKLCFINNNALTLIYDRNSNDQPLEQFISSCQIVMSDNFKIEDLSLSLSGVVGIANFPEHGHYAHQLVNHALLAVNQAEQLTTKWNIYHLEASAHQSKLLTMAAGLNDAIDNNELALYHQPQIDLKTLRVCSSECLIRWQYQGEMIPPTVFVPLAEDMGIINKLTLWVINKALQQHKKLMDEHGFNHMISINISGKDINHQGFFNNVIDIIEQVEIPTDKIIFELTESFSFTDNKQALAVVNKFNELGITISIDDYGTGYSTLAQINELPFQELKVDRQFVENICADKKRKIITEATVKMAKGLGLEVVAEGINSQEDEDTLRDFGCDIGQGYFYAKPMPFNDYIEWLNRLVNGQVTTKALEGEFIPAPKE